MSDALQQVLDETRQRFIATFVARCDAIRTLVDEVAALGQTGPVAELTDITHRLSGLGGTIGFPTISTRASELEELVDGAVSGAFDAALAREVVDALRDAFTTDLASPPTWALPAISTARGSTILVAENDEDQQVIVTVWLQSAGYVPIAVVSGDLVVATARAEKPALILLDIAMPRLDGLSVCRLLKADPELADIPVIFMTTSVNLDDELAGLALGGDEFLIKPVDMRDLILRIQLLLEPGRPRRSPAAAPAAVPATRTVVVAEDDRDVRRIVGAQLREAGYKTISVFDGEEALAALRDNAADVLVLDLMMPKLGGFDVLAAVRESPAPRPRILVLSGHGREEDVVRAFELGADDYMTKPFNLQELVARIARLFK